MAGGAALWELETLDAPEAHPYLTCIFPDWPLTPIALRGQISEGSCRQHCTDLGLGHERSFGPIYLPPVLTFEVVGHLSREIHSTAGPGNTFIAELPTLSP